MMWETRILALIKAEKTEAENTMAPEDDRTGEEIMRKQVSTRGPWRGGGSGAEEPRVLTLYRGPFRIQIAVETPGEAASSKGETQKKKQASGRKRTS